MIRCYLFLFKTVPYIPNATQADAGFLSQLQFAPDRLHMVTDQLLCLTVIQFLPDFFIDLAVR